jgi:AraC-like DNA-binding protein/ligand-binding sensor protein
VNPYLSGIGKKLMLPAELTGSTIRKPAQYPIHACRGYSTHHSSRVVVNARKAKIMNGDGELIETLEHSALYQGYQHAFTAATGLPLALRPMVTWQLPLHGKPGENSFCSMTAEKSRTCAACLQLQDRLAKAATQSSCTMTCGYGLSETAVPIRLGAQTIGYLQTGQVLLKKPTPARFRQAVKEAQRMGVDLNTPRVRQAYFATPVMSRHKMDSVANLLGVFADHLAIQSNQIAVQQASAEPPVIARAKRFIEDHHRDDLSLGQVAASVHTSLFYFCKLFKRHTGVSFTEYVSRLRTEKAKKLLLNLNLRVSEIAYEVGFQSLTHFNRVFKRILHESPSEYRARLQAA